MALASSGSGAGLLRFLRLVGQLKPGVAGGYAAEAGPGTRARSMPSAATTQAMAMLRSGSGRQEPKPLHRVPRTGWVYRNVEKPESVSDHMYRMAVMAMVTRDDRLNKDRCIRLALVHDMAECIVGDIAPADNIPKEEKHRREEEAMKQITQLLPEDLRKELYELWEEYETQSSEEAKFVKQLDQCEMILQASEYEDLENKPGRLQDFYDSTAGKFSHPEIVQLVSELETERNASMATASAEPGS
ncbi:5'-deoxynucleotidase HDDC2 isoform 2 [Mus musculus]|uniref:5'-deoxynucleotidase HDDC2 isoform 2 n=2 Tax=Mus musculus TaxID=10090 RepID=UPI00237B7406|nr:5'-deoxynucleotidase HDDC2 isoform 2 [Mus musculus]